MNKGNGGLLVVAAMVATIAGGCAGGDTSLYVKNGSPEEWYLKVQRGGNDDYPWVVKVAPGADAFAFSWTGGRTVPVAVLASDCTEVGTFAPGDDAVYLVEAVPGLTARIENRGGPFGSRTTTPGIDDTEDCGGFTFK